LKIYCFECSYSRPGKKRLIVTRIFSEIIAFAYIVLKGWPWYFTINSANIVNDQADYWPGKSGV